MAVAQCEDGKWRIVGSGRCIYDTKAEAERAFRDALFRIKNRDTQ